MKNDEILKDDFLAGLLKKSSLDAPSDDFTSHVMSRVAKIPAHHPPVKPFYLFLRSVFPWVLLAVAFSLFLVFSDLQLAKYFTGFNIVQDLLIPSFHTFLTSLKGLASEKFYSIALLITVCGGILFGLERLISLRASHHRHYLI